MMALILTIPITFVTYMKFLGSYVNQSLSDLIIINISMIIVITAYNTYRILVNQCNPACIVIPNLTEFERCVQNGY